jgi:pantetheine-phosphate adenylyltransferase
MEYDDTLIYDTWVECIEKLGGKHDDVLFTALSRLYADRPYHNFGHIDYCLRRFATVDWENREAAGLAIIYHDAIQFTGIRGLNETLSADVARRHCNKMGIYGPATDTISRCIVATSHEHPAYTGHDPQLVADIDLSVLASEAPSYIVYVDFIRQEYISPVFQEGRKEFLRHMLTRKIYQTDEFARFEEKARDNLFNELSYYAPRVAVGGTFDLFHKGHEALLYEAFKLAGSSGTVYIGLTTNEKASKSHEVQPYRIRKQQIDDWYKQSPFMRRKYFIEPLEDAFGPTIDEDFDVLVASEETRSGAEEVNKRRAQRGMKPIPLRIIPLETLNGRRISSTAIRAGEMKK